ncbi:enoyl-CoA hydratase/isomerase family protein [Paraburkholderia sp. EG286B]|uniref:enoyl-CoA hydratase/isomerase family protein n=1 Tax=Paraburkholderia sp. EG286B TaxID=3237011 RepID=UPI0034D1D4C5
MSDAVLYEMRDRVAIITINRPESRNAISEDVRVGLFEAFRIFNEDDNALVAILTAAGDRAFCAGMNLKALANAGGKIPPWREFLPVLGEAIQVGKPVIAAVNGAARAGGWLLAQMCDLCVAAENATFGISEVRVGRGTPWSAPLAQMLGRRHYMELVLTGEPIDAQRAYEIGFVNKVVPSEKLLDEALALADCITRNAPLSVRAARELVYLTGEMGTNAATRAADHLFATVYASEDAVEGPQAFQEKRAPVWRGR